MTEIDGYLPEHTTLRYIDDRDVVQAVGFEMERRQPCRYRAVIQCDNIVAAAEDFKRDLVLFGWCGTPRGRSGGSRSNEKETAV